MHYEYTEVAPKQLTVQAKEVSFKKVAESVKGGQDTYLIPVK